ncbi:hypothetical protein [Cryptosporangium sp. NPDC051539]|uniref:hypothetical protein n=1 Tax=Cryptosporangium sp. NPDC051539 TaxID=3363962 RepID=UPI0037BD70DA
MSSSIRPARVVAIGLVAIAALCCVWAWMAWTYLLGSKVTIQPGDECLSALQTTTGQVTCSDAMWLTGTQVHQGHLIDYRQSGGEFEYDAIPARLVGETARTRPPVVQYLAGLVGPPLLVGSGVMFLVTGVSRSNRKIPMYQAY